jgi:hypothetical protein
MVTMPERRVLRSWRERVATPLKGPTAEIPEETLRQNAKRGQNPVPSLVGIGEEATAKTSVGHAKTPSFSPGEPFFEQLGPTTWRETAWARARCVWWMECFSLVAEGDLIACPEHRERMAD